MNETVNAGKLLAQKVGVAFLLGLAAYGVPAILDALDAINADGDIHATRKAVVTVLAGVVAAALRYALAKSPINLTATDKLHSIGAPKNETVVVAQDKA